MEIKFGYSLINPFKFSTLHIESEEEKQDNNTIEVKVSDTLSDDEEQVKMEAVKVNSEKAEYVLT